jgi:deoxyadenosine/deoxycytidine kinase
MGRVQVIVEGMTASGKSTVVNLLSERLGLQVMPEEFRDQYDLLRRFHHERRWAFPMQLNFLVTRFAQYLCASESENYILDRSVFGDKIYATLYYRLGYFRDSQFGTYLMLYDSLLKHLAMPRLMIVLSCPFEEIMRRIRPGAGRMNWPQGNPTGSPSTMPIPPSGSLSAPRRGFPTAGS